MVWEMITAGFKAIASIFDFATKKTELNNSVEMQQALKNQREQQEKDKDVKIIQNTVKTDNLDDLRKHLSG